MSQPIKKLNPIYLLAYICAPIVICAICYTLYALCFRNGGTGAVLTTMVPSILAFLWWVLGGTLIFKAKTKVFEQQFVNEGYQKNQTFYGRGKTVILDVNKGMMGIIFFWNPFETFILPASHIDRAWVDDGKSGTGILEGSSRVSFLFTIDKDIQVRVNTFTSNQRFRMTDHYITTGIAKAERMVKTIEEAKKNSHPKKA